jgi:NAD(P)H-dependent FMN reductase
MSRRLLVIPGTTRTEAFSKKLARAAGALAVEHGFQATVLDLREHAMPLYDGDLEQKEGLPPAAVALRGIVKGHDAVLFATAEYNASLPAVLKNTIDWLSRPYAQEPGVSVWKDKVAALLSSSPGALGGQRALVHLRQVLMNLGLLVITEQFALGHAKEAFAPDGSLRDEKQQAGVHKVLQRLAFVSGRLAGPELRGTESRAS